MKTNSLRIPIFHLLILLSIVLLLPSLACSLGGLTIGANATTVNISLTEDQVNEILKNSYVTNDTGTDRLLDRITSVEMHDGYIRIFGTGKTPDGEEVQGSFDVSMGVENDVLQVKIIAVDFPGVELNDPRIEKANQEIKKGLTESVTESNGDVQYKEAEITNDKLNLKIQINYPKK